ncbi:alpha/beta hydrolase [Kitasatospora sp. SUK 42]|uniref:alpha/beta hydrolase n=1 Tax=Kitasatospora sp. SUK 42 TaxID=1588882 RepID=UPI0018CA883F|nr:alpha/beta hydrolase [Kitasatospora sp. SUK 42]MBV2155006.1 alpha/beta hydrolase [Kitasatospora sp. SUK 42]
MIRRRSLLTLASLGGAAALLPAAPAQAAPPRTIDLPAPTVGRPVGTTTLHLIDHDRLDPFAPTPGPRELMVQLWYPALAAAGRPRAPYTTPRVAAVIEQALSVDPGTLTLVRPTARVDAPAHPGPLPLLLLGHGRKGGRSNCTALAEELAAHGYLVAAVDHTYDAAAVEFPDGRLVRSVLLEEPPDRDTAERKEVATRVGDLAFVTTYLTSRHSDFRVDESRIGALGHSLGGAAAAEALRQDARLRIGADLDGGLFGSPVPELGLDRPFLLLTGFPDHDTWQRWREHHHAWGRQLHTAGAGHYSFTDLPHVAASGHLRDHLPADLYAALIGTITADRATEVTRTYVRAFADRFLRDRPAPLLDGPSPRFPEVEFLWSRG